MVTYLGGSILITIFALGGSIVSYNLHLLEVKQDLAGKNCFYCIQFILEAY